MNATVSGNRQRLVILGSTGSVGANTLDVAQRHPDAIEVVGLSAFRRMDDLAAQCDRILPRWAVVPDDASAKRLKALLSPAARSVEVLVGPAGLCELAAHPEVDSVMASIVGAAGLAPCLAAARSGKRLLLANKEALVVGGGLFIEAVKKGGATLLPIDSEHSAIFQCLPQDRNTWPDFIDHVVLTASGGPFRQTDPDTFHTITPAQAVAHPNWVMGRKISVDSATMMNKALEVIEARWLFDLRPSDIRVVIHPQSIIHSMVVCRDASVLAQMGTPDMRVPIAYGLSFPLRMESGASRLDFLSVASLTFEVPDDTRFPGLKLAYEVLAAPEGSSVVLNAANEVAVEAFLGGQVPFPAIHRINQGTIESLAGRFEVPGSLEDLLELDARARSQAMALAAKGGTR
ncbi:MAG: 1-deoxy-D-xylulose-5-phosphate reductoisomerase [Betaproteobacteria bacterium]|jgi:1-deoxy-D-xylulose-5-phosphate reductoisomerase